MLGPVKDGGQIVTGTEPACYGPMITPEVESGHTISRPVAVTGAEVGDGVALRIKKIKITSKASASGTETPREGSFVGDPFVAKKCPGCGKVNPNTVVKGVGRDAICCADCNTSISAFDVTNGYTMIFDDKRTVGVTVPQSRSRRNSQKCRRLFRSTGRIYVPFHIGFCSGRYACWNCIEDSADDRQYWNFTRRYHALVS